MRPCFFIGHRTAPESVFSLLCDTVEKHIREYGVEEFVVGQYGNFDRMAVQALKDAKKRHPAVTLTLLLPYHPAERSVPIPKGFDGTLYPSGMETAPKRFAIHRANHWMASHSDFLIAYVRRPMGNSWELMQYAMRRGIHIENLAE